MDVEGKKETRPHAAGWALRMCRHCGERHATKGELRALGIEIAVAVFNATLVSGKIDAWLEADRDLAFIVDREVRCFFYAAHWPGPMHNDDAGTITAQFIERVSREAIAAAEHLRRCFEGPCKEVEVFGELPAQHRLVKSVAA